MLSVYSFTKDLPHYLQYDVGQDVRRAARSVPSNICEGYSRKKSARDVANFLRTALGSNDEVLFNLDVLISLKVISHNDYLKLHEECTIVGKQITKLLKTINL